MEISTDSSHLMITWEYNKSIEYNWEYNIHTD